MKIAIVGTSKLTSFEEGLVRREVLRILVDVPENTIIISGGAKGVDTVAIETAKYLNLSYIIYFPVANNWDEFKKRNMSLAEDCDKLFCITFARYDRSEPKCYHHSREENHRKTAGCWTLKHAFAFNKKTKLIVIKDRLT